jgi:cell wall-associated NlpC family hydrolase
MSIIIGSARIDENGKATGGKLGDQKQTSNTNDTKGEVSMQSFYVHTKGWNVLRAKQADIAKKIAAAMKTACNNVNIGYDQSNRGGVIKYGTATETPTECDCSSLVRQCVKEAAGIDSGDFTTGNEVSKLAATGLFEAAFAYTSDTVLYTGDILVTKTKGHTAVVVTGNERPTQAVYYPKYTGASSSIVDALKAVGETDTTKAHRTKIATANGVTGYTGAAAQNAKLLKLLKAGELVKA